MKRADDSGRLQRVRTSPGYRSAFAPRSRRRATRGSEVPDAAQPAGLQEAAGPAAGQDAQVAEGQRPAEVEQRVSHANRVIAAFMVTALLITAVQIVVEVVFSGTDVIALVRGDISTAGIYAVVYYVFSALVIVGLVAVIYLDYTQRIFQARMVIRALVVLLVLGLLVQILLNGISWPTAFYVIQFVCVVSYQVYNDPNLSRPPRFLRPKEGPAARERAYELDPKRRGYIPMNFFNLFWIFMVASVIGLVIETVYMLLSTGVLKDRTCMLWGPFSPIYGVGAVLMTVAVNRWWYRNAGVIFVVTGIVGAALEFFVSWYLETAFGVWSWDYSGAFLSIGGRTDFAHACAWGFLGVVWVRLLLPSIMRVVDAIPLRWRASVTCVAMALMLVNCTMTVMALDCWSARQAGEEVAGITQEFFAEHYDDVYMEKHFATLKMVQ